MPSTILSDNGVSSGTSGIKTTGANDGQLALQTTTAGGTATTALTIDTSQNVGIGTSSPTYKLDVVSASTSTGSTIIRNNNTQSSVSGNLHVTGSAYSYAGVGASTVWLQGASGNVTIGSDGAYYTSFVSNGSERARITYDGKFLVGTTGDGATSAAYFNAATIANGNVGVVRIQSAQASDSSSTAMSVVKQANDTTTSNVFVRFYVNAGGTNSGQINANGASTAAFGTFSDARLKENITNLPSQLANILALRPVEFDYIQSEGGGHQIGFIAQEMEQVYPDVVAERADGMKTITAWSKTEARLVKAIQELNAKVEAQAAEIAALKAKV